MTYGVDLQSGFNSTLIDGGFVVVRGVNTHSISTGSPNSSGVCTGSVTVTNLPAADYVALTDDSRFHTLTIESRASGGYVVTVYIESATATSVTVRVAGPVAPSPGSAYGLEVYGTAGNILFSTDVQNYTVIGDILLTAPAEGATSSFNPGAPAGRNALIQPYNGLLGYRMVAATQSFSQLQFCFFRKVSNTEVQYKFRTIDLIPVPPDAMSQGPFNNYMPLFIW